MQANYPPKKQQQPHNNNKHTHTHTHIQNPTEQTTKTTQQAVKNQYHIIITLRWNQICQPKEREGGEREREIERIKILKRTERVNLQMRDSHKNSYLQVQKKHKTTTTATNKNILLCHFRTTTLTVLHLSRTSCADRLATPQTSTLLGIWPHTLLFKLLVIAWSCLVINCEKNCCPFSFVCSFLEKTSHFILSKTDLFGDWHSISFFFTACQNNLDKRWEIKTTFAHHCWQIKRQSQLV